MSTFMDHIHRGLTPEVGQRVGVPAYTDAWMEGDRYGVVAHTHPAGAYFLPEWVTVRLDKSGREQKFVASDCVVIPQPLAVPICPEATP